MTEPTVLGTPGTPGTPETPETPVPASIIGGDGNFVENYWDHLGDDYADIKDAQVLREINNPKEGLKMLVNAQRKIGKNKIPLPGENADATEWNEFFLAAGKPKTADDYPYDRPENVPEDRRSETWLKDRRQSAHEMNWTVRQWNQYMKAADAELVSDIEAAEINAQADLETAEKKLKDLWGMAYEERINVANRLIATTIPDGAQFSFTREQFIAELGRSPVFVEWAASVGKELAEHEVLIAELSKKAPKEAQAELDDLHASEDYQKFLRGEYAKTNPSKHRAILKKESDLYDIIHPAGVAGS